MAVMMTLMVKKRAVNHKMVVIILYNVQKLNNY